MVVTPYETTISDRLWYVKYNIALGSGLAIALRAGRLHPAGKVADSGRGSRMTSDRAREILETGEATGNFSQHMTPGEIAELERHWSRMARSTSYQELLTIIA